MFTFIVLAACMAAIAAAVVAVPLLRDRKSRLVGAIAGVVVVAVAAGLYPLWSTWDWSAPKAGQGVPASPEVAAMISKLEKHLDDQPNDLDGWLMLGRSYAALERADDAIVAYNHAYRLGGGKNIEATLGLGEALGLKAGGEVTARAAELFEEAVTAAPDNPRALFFGGYAAAVRGDRDLARSRWQALKALNPPPEVVKMLDAQIAELDGASAGPFAGGGAGAQGGGAGDGGGGAGPGMGGAGGASAGPVDPKAQATVNIKIAAALRSRLKPDVPLFVFAREPDSRGPPLAAKRLTVAAIGTQMQLSQADAMIPSHALASGQTVSITARVSFSGQPTPATGDLFGEITYVVGHDGVRDLVIDQVAP